MSWQIGSFALVTLALGAGLLWYERSRPPSQIVALVAVLAAMAVAGRILLAPIPNVVATTDIVIFAGYVLGPAPGFAVGALGGLISNFWLGQGAWTPWQMVGWGMAGIGGAALWRLTRGRVDRFTLALACGLAGLAFGAWMNLQTMVSYGGDMSLDRYLALEVRAIPFDLAHMTGNIAFALVAGPAMISALRRFRERFEWRRASGTAGTGLILLAVTVAILGGTASAPSPAEAAYPKEATKAAGWLRTQQNADGGFPASVGGESSFTFTARSMLGLAAAGINPLDVKTDGKSPYDYLVAHRKGVDKANEIALAILALRTVDKNPRKFEGRNLMEALHKRQGNGSFGNDVNVAAWAAVAFRSGGADGAAQKSIDWLYTAQNVDTNGGWGIAKGAKSDPDSTGAALMAVRGKKRIRKAMGYLRNAQKASGGFVSGSTVNSQSTGLVILGMVAVGKGPRFLKSHGNTAADYLLARQQDDGSVWYSKESDQTRVWVTADAIPALAADPPPIDAPPRAEKPKEEPKDTGTTNNSTNSTGTYDPGPGSIVSPSTSSGPSKSSRNGSGGKQPGNGAPSIPDDSPAPSDDPPTTPINPVVPVVPSDAVLAASQAGPAPSPVIALLICLLVSGGLCGGTIWLVRRFGW